MNCMAVTMTKYARADYERIRLSSFNALTYHYELQHYAGMYCESIFIGSCQKSSGGLHFQKLH